MDGRRSARRAAGATLRLVAERRLHFGAEAAAAVAAAYQGHESRRPNCSSSRVRSAQAASTDLPAAVLLRHLGHETERVPHTKRARRADVANLDGGHLHSRRGGALQQRGSALEAKGGGGEGKGHDCHCEPKNAGASRTASQRLSAGAQGSERIPRSLVHRYFPPAQAATAWGPQRRARRGGALPSEATARRHANAKWARPAGQASGSISRPP